MKSDKVLLPVILTKVATKADRTLSLSFNTRELGKDASILFELILQEGYLLFSPNDDITADDIPDVTPDAGVNSKSPSQRLRDRMYVYFKNVKKGEDKNFQIWYGSELERIGEVYLEGADS